jgi:hypothetical protein
MSQQCPKCGLFNPPDAARCDCGYDFASKSVKSSYLLAHVLEKHGGDKNTLRSQCTRGTASTECVASSAR